MGVIIFIILHAIAIAITRAFNFIRHAVIVCIRCKITSIFDAHAAGWGVRCPWINLVPCPIGIEVDHTAVGREVNVVLLHINQGDAWWHCLRIIATSTGDDSVDDGIGVRDHHIYVGNRPILGRIKTTI